MNKQLSICSAYVPNNKHKLTRHHTLVHTHSIILLYLDVVQSIMARTYFSIIKKIKNRFQI